MQHLLLAMIVGLSLSGMAFAGIDQKERSSDFRGTHWGMSKAEVIQAEGRTPDREAVSHGLDVIHYDDRFADHDTTLVYAFTDDRLVLAQHVFVTQHVEEAGRHLEAYDAVKGYLHEQYGNPDQDAVIWVDPSDQADQARQDKDRALRLGQLRYEESWTIDGTRIVHMIKGHHFKIYHGVEFRSTAYTPAAP